MDFSVDFTEILDSQECDSEFFILNKIIERPENINVTISLIDHV